MERGQHLHVDRIRMPVADLRTRKCAHAARIRERADGELTPTLRLRYFPVRVSQQSLKQPREGSSSRGVIYMCKTIFENLLLKVFR